MTWCSLVKIIIKKAILSKTPAPVENVPLSAWHADARYHIGADCSACPAAPVLHGREAGKLVLPVLRSGSWREGRDGSDRPSRGVFHMLLRPHDAKCWDKGPDNTINEGIVHHQQISWQLLSLLLGGCSNDVFCYIHTDTTLDMYLSV